MQTTWPGQQSCECIKVVWMLGSFAWRRKNMNSWSNLTSNTSSPTFSSFFQLMMVLRHVSFYNFYFNYRNKTKQKNTYHNLGMFLFDLKDIVENVDDFVMSTNTQTHLQLHSYCVLAETHTGIEMCNMYWLMNWLTEENWPSFAWLVFM